MATTLPADLASLDIDRAKTLAGGPPKAPLGWLLFAIIAVVAYVKGKPYLESEFFETEVELTQISQLATQAQPIVPAAAVVERHGKRVVFVFDGEIAHMQSVTLGPAIGDGFALQAGPEAGTQVIKAPADSLVDGQKVSERTP
jgi:hypothetical protein